MTQLRARRALAPLALLLIVATAAPSGAYERPGRTIRVSVASDGTQADVNARPPKFIPNSKGFISENGRYVTFEAWAPNLVPEDREGILRPHIYRHDLLTRETERVTLRWDGHKSNQGGRGAEMSSDGRYVAYYSASSDVFETPDTTRGTDVYVRDMVLGVNEKITVAPDGSDASNGSPINLNNSFFKDLSPSGRYVLFSSSCTNLMETADQNGTVADLYLRDRETQKTEIISVSTDGTQGDDVAGWGNITADGTEVFFESYATNLVDQPVGPGANLYVRNRIKKSTALLEVAGKGQVANGEMTLEGVSHDGRFVLFNSGATNLIPYDGNAAWDTFVYDRQTQRTERISVANDGSEADGESYGWEISPDGRYVTINSQATNLVEGDTNGRDDTFVHDRLLGITRRISVASDGSQGNRHAYYGSISADATLAAFDSTASNLVEGDTNEEKDIFVRELGPQLGVGQLDIELSEDQAHVSGWAGFSGSVVAEASDPPGDVADASADLIGAAAVVRPEVGSTRLIWDARQLNPVGAPGVIYGMSFDAGDSSWEIRGMPTVPGTPRFHLYECATTCVRTQELRGRYGREGSSVVVTVPEGTGPFVAGARLTDAAFYTALGEGLIAKIADTDRVEVGELRIVAPSLTLGIAARGTSDVVYQDPSATEAGVFGEVVDLDGRDPRTHDLWVTTCLGAACTSTVRELAPAPDEEPLVPTALTIELSKERGDIRASIALSTQEGIGLPGRNVTISLNGTDLGIVTTDAAGTATFDIPRKDAKAGDEVGATFLGDDDYLGATASRIIVTQDL